jgi:hypothetical protein
MNRILILLLLPLLSGCKVLTADPWRWMDDPALQRWVDIELEISKLEVQFAIPIQLNGKGSFSQTRSTLPLSSNVDPIQVFVPLKTEYIGTRIATFNWDHWWGGFFKDSGVDFFLSVQCIYYKDGGGFLNMSPDEWIEWRKQHWRREFSDPRMGIEDLDTYFFDGYRIDKYNSKRSLTWVFDNRPHLQQELISYMTPISDHHMLYFGFFVDELRTDMKPDPEWRKRRWAMAHKILDTVEITPRPGKF